MQQKLKTKQDNCKSLGLGGRGGGGGGIDARRGREQDSCNSWGRGGPLEEGGSRTTVTAWDGVARWKREGAKIPSMRPTVIGFGLSACLHGDRILEKRNVGT